MEEIEAPQPLLPPGRYSTEDPKPFWALKKLSLARCTPGVGKAGRQAELKKEKETLPAIYEEPSVSEKIPIKYASKITDKRYTQHLIYESYKPRNFKEMQDYLNFILQFRKILPNAIGKYADELKEQNKTAGRDIEEILSSSEVSEEIRNYYNSEVETKLPTQLDQERILIFDSNFECGNLDRVTIVSLNEYNLFLNPDTNTKGHSMWFYYAVTNTERGRRVTFNILNCANPVLLVKSGMKPMAFSEIDNEENDSQWTANTTNVNCVRNTIPKNPRNVEESLDTERYYTATYYTLSFSYTFTHSGDRVYFAFCKPYSVTMLRCFLAQIRNTLLENAKNMIMLEEEGLQRRIRMFVEEEENKKMETLSSHSNKKQCFQPEDQFKMNNRRKKEFIPQILKNRSVSLLLPESSLVASEILKEYATSGKAPRFPWLKSQEFQIETENFIYRQETLNHTLSGFPIELITITNYASTRYPLKMRKIILISARVHAAETAGSFKMEGILSFLTSINPLAHSLRNLFIFKIVPMLNPEGVMCGNFRCSLTGTDLNRRWDHPDEILHSQIYYFKNLLRKLTAEKREILVFCDLHGHSKKTNSFIFGCNKAAKGGFCSWTKVRLLPRILARRTHLFSYKDCKFRVESDKQRTARVVLWREFGVTNSFTLESSFYGYNYGDEIRQFSPEDYSNLGESILLSLLEYHYVLRDIEKELKITKGWLKPSKLLALTGTPAADVLAKKIANKKEEQKKIKRLLRIKEVINEKKMKAKAKQGHSKKGRSKKKQSECKESLRQSRKYTQDELLQNVSNILTDNGGISFANKKCNKSTYNSPKLSETFLPEISNTRKSAHIVIEKVGSEEEKGGDDPSSEEESTKQKIIKPEISRAWRSYFSQEEIEQAYSQINKGYDPNENEQEDYEASDSNPSEDDLEKEDMQELLMSLPTNRKASPEDSKETIQEVTIPEVPEIPEEKKLNTEDISPQIKERESHTHFEEFIPKKVEMPWENTMLDCPSLIITSKNNCKAGSLINQGQEDPQTLYSTYSKRNIIQKIEPKARKSYASPIMGKSTEHMIDPEPGYRKMPAFSGNFQTGKYSNIRRRETELPRSKPVTRKQGSAANITESLLPGIKNDQGAPKLAEVNFSATQGESLSASANLRMIMEHSPFININIKNVNINQPGTASLQKTPLKRVPLRIPARTEMPRINKNVNVIGSVPRHENVLERIFDGPQRNSHDIKQEKIRRYEREQRSSKLQDLLWKGFFPVGLCEVIEATKNRRNISFCPERGSRPPAFHN